MISQTFGIYPNVSGSFENNNPSWKRVITICQIFYNISNNFKATFLVFLVLQRAEKTGMLITSAFLSLTFGISLLIVKINDFFGILRPDWTKQACFERKAWVLNLALASAFPWVKFEDACHHRILSPKGAIKHVSHYTYHTTFLFGDFIWPDFDLYLALGICLYRTFFTSWEAFITKLGPF